MTVRVGFVAVALLAAIVMRVTPAQATPTLDLDGAQLSGALIINGGGNNQFDPQNGHVPPGFGNSPSPGGSGEPFALLSDSLVEFGYQGGVVVSLSVDFTTAGLVTVTGSPSPFTSMGVSIVSPSFAPLSLTPVSGTPFGTCGLTNDTFACNFGTATASFTVVSQLITEAVPEPASLTLLGLGLAGLAFRLRKPRQR